MRASVPCVSLRSATRNVEMERAEGRRLAFVVSQVPKCEGPGPPDSCGLPPIEQKPRAMGHPHNIEMERPDVRRLAFVVSRPSTTPATKTCPPTPRATQRVPALPRGRSRGTGRSNSKAARKRAAMEVRKSKEGYCAGGADAACAGGGAGGLGLGASCFFDGARIACRMVPSMRGMNSTMPASPMS